MHVRTGSVPWYRSHRTVSPDDGFDMALHERGGLLDGREPMRLFPNVCPFGTERLQIERQKMFVQTLPETTDGTTGRRAFFQEEFVTIQNGAEDGRLQFQHGVSIFGSADPQRPSIGRARSVF